MNTNWTDSSPRAKDLAAARASNPLQDRGILACHQRRRVRGARVALDRRNGLWSPHRVSRDEPLFPAAQADVPANFAWCVGAASHIALSRLSPETLVWKLAAVVAYPVGGPGRRACDSNVGTLRLFELLAAQLHHFPESPAFYRPQENEQELEDESRALLLLSVSGAGKTAWASYSTLHTGAAIVYFDAAGLADAAVASSLLREATAVQVFLILP